MSLFIETIPGVFISECKNRFLSNVKINEKVVECYVPSSSRIENYLQVNNCEVLVTKNQSKKTRTKYSLFAVKFENNYIILNLNKVNSILEQLIVNGWLYPKASYTVYKEKMVARVYKSDLYLSDSLGDNNIIIEAKGIISDERVIEFPQVYSERSVKQLNILHSLLEKGETVHYYLICLSPLIKQINLVQGNKYTEMLKKCIDQGLKLRILRLHYDGYQITFDQDVEVSV